MFVTGLQNIVKGIIGEEGERYVPYLVTVMMYIGLSNIIGLLGMKPPTKDLNVTGALGLLSIFLSNMPTFVPEAPRDGLRALQSR